MNESTSYAFSSGFIVASIVILVGITSLGIFIYKKSKSKNSR